MIGGRPDRGAEDYWKETSFTYKYYCLTSTVIFMISLLIPAIAVFFIDIPQLTIWSFQIWKLFLSMYGQMPGIISILSLLFSFMWIYRMIKDEEGSTIYKIFEIIIINFEIHIVFNVISLIFTLLFETSQLTLFLGFGWFPIIIVYEFRESVINPEAQKRFCCLPFLIKSKYFPWVILALMTLFTNQLFCFVACGIVGYYQQVVRKQMVIKLPIWVYEKVQSCLPASIKNREDFVKIARVQQRLQQLCTKSAAPRSRGQHTDNENAFRAPNTFDNPANSRSVVQASTPAATIGGSGGNSINDFRNYWAHKDQKQQSKTTNEAEIQIQPQAHYGNQNFHKQSQQDNTYASFNDNYPQNQGLLSEQQGKNKKKKEGENNDLI